MKFGFQLSKIVLCSLLTACSPSAKVKVCMEHLPGRVRPCTGKSNWWTEAVKDDGGTRSGTRIMKVEEGSGAYQMGFRTGDIIRKINGETVAKFYSPCSGNLPLTSCYARELEALKGGFFYDDDARYMDVLVERDGKEHHVIYEVFSREIVRRGI